MISRSRWTNAVAGERGAVLIQVAVALLALLALSAFVFDYGVMWASRGQAQNSADAGALSGAISLAFNSPTDQAAARARAIAMAQANKVWNQAPSVTDADVTFPACPPGIPGPQDQCVKVNVFANQARGNPVPTFFASSVGFRTKSSRYGDRAGRDRRHHLVPEAVGRGRSVERIRTRGTATAADIDLRQYRPARGTPLPRRTTSTFHLLRRAPAPDTRSRRTAGISLGSRWDQVGKRDFLRLVQDSRSARADTELGNSTVQDNILTCNGMPASFANPATVCPRRFPITGRTPRIGQPADAIACNPARPLVLHATRSKR